MDQIKTGRFIAELRKGKGYTQSQLADILQISDRTVSKWERGIGMPDTSLMLPLCQELHISGLNLCPKDIGLTKRDFITLTNSMADMDFTGYQELNSARLKIQDTRLTLIIRRGLLWQWRHIVINARFRVYDIPCILSKVLIFSADSHYGSVY